MSHDSVEVLAEDIQGTPPGSNLYEVEHGVETEGRWVEIVVSNGITPPHQLVKQFPPPPIVCMERVDLVPE
jgi:hypothetical protein